MFFKKVLKEINIYIYIYIYMWILGYGYCKRRLLKCQRDVKIDSFEGGFKTCNVCREKGRRQYHNIYTTEKCAERKKQFKENNPEKYKEQRKNGVIHRKKKTFHEVMVCSICHYSINKYKKS